MEIPPSPGSPPPLSDSWTSPPPFWTVYVDDNFHYMDEDSRTSRGRCATLDEAVAICMEITRQSVGEHDGIGGYCMFGEDPWVFPAPPPEELAALLARHPDWPAEAFAGGYFSARSYAAVLLRQA